jgi:hypothetical protein
MDGQRICKKGRGAGSSSEEEGEGIVTIGRGQEMAKMDCPIPGNAPEDLEAEGKWICGGGRRKGGRLNEKMEGGVRG